MASSLPLGKQTSKTTRAATWSRNELLPRFLTLLLLLFLARTLAQLTWQLLAAWPGASPGVGSQAPPPRSEPAIVKTNLGSSAETLANLHLFGRPRPGVEPVGAESASHPPTSLNIALLGVVFLSGSQKSVAIIAEKGNKASESIYLVGGQLPGNATITEIFADRVTLRRGGRLETILLEEPVATSSGGEEANRLRPPGGAEKIATVTSQVKIDRQRWDQQLGDVAGLANEIGVEVYPAGSSQQGYRLKGKSDSKVLADLGLQNGDVLLEIDGTPLHNASTALQAFEKMKKAEAISLQILRDGRRQTKQYTIGQFKAAP